PGCRADRQRQAAGGRLPGRAVLPGVQALCRNRVRRRVSHRGRLPQPLCARADRGGRWLDAVAADSLQLRHHQLRSAGSGTGAASADNWLGTDDQARDVLARVIYGFRISVLFALTLTILSSIIGVVAGAIQGFYGGRIDLFGQRFIEVWSGLPVLY